jgi:hypothetical protein
MRGNNRWPWRNRPRPDRLVWLSILAALALGIWPVHVILASTSMSGQVSGEIHLQGRLDHSGVEVQIQPQSGSGDLTIQGASTSVQVTTSSQGEFSASSQGVLIITARKQGYLDAQATIGITSDEPLDLGPTTLYGGEVTGDNLIDISDLAYLGASFNSGDSKGDINGDGQVDILDLALAAANFTMSGPTPWGESSQ